MEVLVAYESSRGRVPAAAELLARAVRAHGAEATTKPVDRVGAGEVEAADALIVGCWVKGNVPFGGRQASHMGSWISGLPSLAGKPAAAFCTYSFLFRTFADAVTRTAETLDLMRRRLEAKGATVVATRSLRRRSGREDIEPLVRRVLGIDATSSPS